MIQNECTDPTPKNTQPVQKLVTLSTAFIFLPIVIWLALFIPPAQFWASLQCSICTNNSGILSATHSLPFQNKSPWYQWPSSQARTMVRVLCVCDRPQTVHIHEVSHLQTLLKKPYLELQELPGPTAINVLQTTLFWDVLNHFYFYRVKYFRGFGNLY